MTPRILPTIAAVIFLAATPSFAREDAATNSPGNPASDAAKTNGTSADGGAKKGNASAQSEAASKTVTLEKVAKDSEDYKAAIDAHDLAKAKAQVDEKGAFKGKITGTFEPRGGSMAILNFDQKYQTALTALLKKENFSKFPDLKMLVGKEVVISGKFIDFQGRSEVILTEPGQIKLVE